MVVVQTIDRMTSNLGPLLLGDTNHVQINSSNISTSLSMPIHFYIYPGSKCVLRLTVVYADPSIIMSDLGLQVKQKNVSESSQGSEFCGFDTAGATDLDCIFVPPQSMQELRNEGT